MGRPKKIKEEGEEGGEDMSKLDEIMAELNKKMGAGTVIPFSQTKQRPDVIPTGSLGLDLAIGIGGVPRGRVTTILGPESSGKTTLALSIVAQAQKMGLWAGYIDMEHAVDFQYAANVLGVDPDKMQYSEPYGGEDALTIAQAMVQSKVFGVVVIDSVANLIALKEAEGEMGDAQMATVARLMSQASRKISPYLRESNTALIFINQLRQKIGIQFGNPETSPGGNALKYWESVRLDVRRKQWEKDGEVVVGAKTTVKVAKNKVAAPMRVAMFDIMFTKGISSGGELVDLGEKFGVITKSGASFKYGEEKIGFGRANTIERMETDPELASTIRTKIMEIASSGTEAMIVTDDSSLESPGDDI